jgi:putative membrane fusion protein
VGVALAREGRVEETISCQGFVIRHETVLRSPVTGTVSLSLAEGERARAGAEVAQLADAEERREAAAAVARLEAELAAYDAERGPEKEALEAELAAIRAEGQAQAENLRLACLAADFPGIDASSRALAVAGRRRRDAEDRLAVIREGRERLEQELAAAEGALERSTFPVFAPGAGVVSYCLDGLEEILTPDSIGRYTTRQVLAMVSRPVFTAEETRLRAGEPVARIVSDREVLLAVVVTNSQADRMVAVRDVTLRFPAFEGRREAAARLHHVGERERNGYCLITYATGELLDGMVSGRQVEAVIVLKTLSGTVVSRKAVVQRGGMDGVFVLDRNVCRFQPVEVRGGNEDEVVVKGLPAGTPVITTPWLVDEGLRLGG